MTGDSWPDDNNRYLAASLHWLRLTLRRLAPIDIEVSAVTPPAAAPKRRRRVFRQSSAGAIEVWNYRPAGPRPAETDTEALATAVADREAAAAAADPPPALVLLAQRLGLSSFERDTLLLCAAAELDPEMGALFALAQHNSARPYPTFGLALQALDEPTWDALSPHRPLRYARMIEISQSGTTPLTASALRGDERIVNYLKGLNALDERLVALLTPSTDDDASVLAPSQEIVVEETFEHLRAAAAEARVPVITLVGPDPASKLAVAQRLCVALDRRLYRISLESLPTQKAEIDNLARLWQRESMLLAVALLLDAENIDGAATDLAAAFEWFTSREMGLVFIGLRESSARSGGGYSVTVNKPTALEQFEAWSAAVAAGERNGNGERDGDGERNGNTGLRDARALAGQFDLNLGEIRMMADTAGRSESSEPLADRIWDACRKQTQPRLDVLAQRLDPKATWDDLVLADEATSLLRQIVGQVRQRFRVYEEWGFARKMTRGLGINALFTGESGTGKTMAAEVIANELRLSLYRIDLSAVVSKYIGETEKNLRTLFDAAEDGGAILFFDEADALFGKRSEVKDSHDRYANIEINYLLQRMEAFSGLAILATNMKSALDNAFMRRLRFIVTFQYPGPVERASMWKRSLPPEVPQEELDLDRLARFNLSGGNIHSIALNAAFMAASRGLKVCQPLILTAIRAELRKLEKPFNEAEFR
jgi:AAA+ superfamily predicted ATPase